MARPSSIAALKNQMRTTDVTHNPFAKKGKYFVVSLKCGEFSDEEEPFTTRVSLKKIGKFVYAHSPRAYPHEPLFAYVSYGTNTITIAFPPVQSETIRSVDVVCYWATSFAIEFGEMCSARAFEFTTKTELFSYFILEIASTRDKCIIDLSEGVITEDDVASKPSTELVERLEAECEVVWEDVHQSHRYGIFLKKIDGKIHQRSEGPSSIEKTNELASFLIPSSTSAQRA